MKCHVNTVNCIKKRGGIRNSQNDFDRLSVIQIEDVCYKKITTHDMAGYKLSTPHSAYVPQPVFISEDFLR